MKVLAVFKNSLAAAASSSSYKKHAHALARTQMHAFHLFRVAPVCQPVLAFDVDDDDDGRASVGAAEVKD